MKTRIISVLVTAVTACWLASLQPASAQSPPPPPASGAHAHAPPGPPAPPVPLDCQTITEPTFAAPGAAPLIITVDPASVWRPLWGQVRLTIQGQSFSPALAEVATCFRWRNYNVQKNTWINSPPPIPVTDPAGIGSAYLATVPIGLRATEPVQGLLDRLLDQAGTQGGKDHGASTARGLVPLADFRVLVRPTGTATWKTVDVQPSAIGITSDALALIVTLVLVLLGWLVLYAFGKLRGVPGAGDPVLQIISTERGYASLSQLQVLIWAFVIGGSAVYVMVLSGNLIPLSSGTLVLLGISGAATLGSQIQTSSSTQGSKSLQTPGQVAALVVSGVSTTEARLSWPSPAGGGGVDAFTVSYKPTGAGAWIVVTASLEGLAQRVTGLMPCTSYDFQVFGSNAAGPGLPATQTESTLTASGLGPVPGFGPAKIANRSLELTWLPLAGAAQYLVEYRLHDGDDGWTRANPATKSPLSLKNLNAYTAYDVRISGTKTAATLDYGQPVTLNLSTIGPRKPLWSDLVVQSDGRNEIDITRVQMLFFTVIVALFVTVRVLTSGEIPDVPSGFLILMGISNGVYLTSKFIPH